MSQITGKTMYVLGAGASVHTGAPLLRDFLVKARLLLESKEENIQRESFQRVFKWIDSLRPSSYYVELDLDNLEHVFSLAEMARQLQLDGADEIVTSLRHVITDTLDACQLRTQRGQVLPDSTYFGFVKRLNDLNKNRLQHTGKASDISTRDVVVTLNYDVMLDHAMMGNSQRPDYGLGLKSGNEHFLLLKLHGSTNWARCKSCQSGPQIIQPNPIPPGHGLLDPFSTDGTLAFRMSTHVLENTPYQNGNCKATGTLEPYYLIPPTWSKTVEGTPLPRVWKSAVNALHDVFQIVVIGYSMPSTDTFFQYLMGLGLKENPTLNRVVVVNVDSSEQLKGRYERVFSRSLKDRGRLKFPPGYGTFGNFVLGEMEKIGTEAGWPYD